MNSRDRMGANRYFFSTGIPGKRLSSNPPLDIEVSSVNARERMAVVAAVGRGQQLGVLGRGLQYLVNVLQSLNGRTSRPSLEGPVRWLTLVQRIHFTYADTVDDRATEPMVHCAAVDGLMIYQRL